jgi:hypothetical protein
MSQSPKFSSAAPRRWSVLDASADNPNAALEYEIAREKAVSLGRLGRRLEAALAALQAFDAAHARARHSGEREALLAEAGTLLWHFIVQRELRSARQRAGDAGLRRAERGARPHGRVSSPSPYVKTRRHLLGTSNAPGKG